MSRTRKDKLIDKIHRTLFSGMIEEESDSLLKLYLAIEIRMHKVTLKQIEEKRLRYILQHEKPKPMRRFIRREAIFMMEHAAIHEAGHAVIARVLGLSCTRATIIPDDLTEDMQTQKSLDGFGLGSVHVEPWETAVAWQRTGSHHKLRSALWAYLIVLMAGDEAVGEFFGSTDFDDPSKPDLDLMADLVADPDAEITNGAWTRYEPRFRRQTRRLIRKHRTKIEVVAAALLREHRLTAGQIDHECRLAD